MHFYKSVMYYKLHVNMLKHQLITGKETKMLNKS